MAAWSHSAKWDGNNQKWYAEYRKYVAQNAPARRSTKDLDCSDLSITLIIEFASKFGLPVTFKDAEGAIYSSKAKSALVPKTSGYDGTGAGAGAQRYDEAGPVWNSSEKFTAIVQEKMQTKSLYLYNMELNSPTGPEAGDLMIRYRTKWLGTKVDQKNTHTALVYLAYARGIPHPLENRKDVPSFPGRDQANNQPNTEYFRGTVDESGATASRAADMDPHFDYLNSPADKKRIAELIYFAHTRQLRDEGFEFYRFGQGVVGNYAGWDGQADTFPYWEQ
jgi:hypothetical protein